MTTTIDSLLDGAVSLEQPAPGHGYRVNADAILLARFSAENVERAPDIIDLGAGVGAVALVLNALTPARSMTFVERDAMAAELAHRNVCRAQVADRTQIVVADVEAWARDCAPASQPLVVANPPYTRPGAGRRGENPSRDAARHGDLNPFVQAIRLVLHANHGRACICYPASSVIDLLDLLDLAGLFARRLRFVHPCPTRPARIVLLELTACLSSPQVLPPWFDSANAENR